MGKWLIVLSLLLSTAAAAETVWMWVDENGQRHYSDRPVEGAQRIELAEVQSFSVPAASSRARADRQSNEPARTYERLEITRPGQGQTVWNIEGTLEVAVAIEPALREGHALDLYLDGERQYLNGRGTTFTVEGVWRGVHALQAVAIGPGGREIMRSDTRNFVVQQTSLLNPNNPNTSPPPGRRPNTPPGTN